MKKDSKKIVLTGGHAGTTGLSVAQEIRKQGLNWNIHWIGSTKSIEGKSIQSLESKYFKKYGVFFHPIVAGRIQRKFTFWTIPSFLKIPVGFVQAFFYLLKIKPFVVLSFGGYASFPVVVVANFFKIPVFIHEQTAVAGRANLASERFADKILLSRNKSKKFFSKKKSIVVGNPILSEYFKRNKRRELVDKTILITGGSRGSQIINNLVKESLEELLDEFKIVHVSGELDFRKLEKIKNGLSNEKKEKYKLFSTVDPLKMIDLYKQSDFVISRAGANTVSELIALKKPTLFIPIPWSYLNEQNENAEFSSLYIPMKILYQDKLTKEVFLGEIFSFVNSDLSFIHKESPDKQASKRIVDFIEGYIK